MRAALVVSVAVLAAAPGAQAAPSGRAVVVIQLSSPTSGRSAIYASERPAGAAAFGALIRVSDGARQVGSAQVALDPVSGRAVAVWLDGRAPSLRAATLPPG